VFFPESRFTLFRAHFCARHLVSLLDWMRAVTKKYLLAIALLCAGAGLSSGAVANQPGVEANQKIRNCIEGARQAGLYPGRCVGLIADPCINSAKDKDGAADKAKECAARELKVWAARLGPWPRSSGRTRI
jgi:hypothetical protein